MNVQNNIILKKALQIEIKSQNLYRKNEDLHFFGKAFLSLFLFLYYLYFGIFPFDVVFEETWFILGLLFDLCVNRVLGVDMGSWPAM